MSLMAAITGAGAVATTFGKGIVKHWAKRLGPEHLREANDVFKRWSMGINYIPVIGPANMLWKGFIRGGAWKGTATRFGELKSRLARDNSALGEVMTSVLSKHAKSRVLTREAYKTLEPSKRKLLKDVKMGFIQSLKTDPRRHGQEIAGWWRDAAGRHGIPAEISNVQNTIIRSGERVRDVAETAMASRDLMSTFMVSNMAAVGMPTIGHTVASIQIAKYLNRKVSSRLRGYEDLNY